MKNYLILIVAFIMLGISFSACEKNDPVGPPPSGESLTTEITASPGDNITFKGTFTTESNFQKIALFNEALQLDKEIVFANTVSKYYLDYSFTIPETISFGNYDVKITAESTDGATEEFIVMVNISSLPEASGLTLNISSSPGNEIHITGNITDAQGLSSVHLQNTGIALDELIELNEAPMEYMLDFTYTIPADADLVVHTGSIIINNLSGRSATYNFTVNLSGQEINYTAIYIAGGVTWWTWNAEHAYLMIPSEDNEKWFETIIPAWPEEDFNEIKFLGQLDWAPDNWGLVDNTDPSLGMVNAEDSQPIQLDAGGSAFYPGYFKVSFNPYDLEYSSEEVDQSGFAMQESMYIVGAGFTDYPNLDWNPEEAIALERNPYGYGDHIFLIEGLNFSNDVSMKFIGQNDGWGPVDVGFDEQFLTDVDEDNGGYQVMAPISWQPTKSGDGTADLKFVDQEGTYTVLYDHFAKRALIWKE